VSSCGSMDRAGFTEAVVGANDVTIPECEVDLRVGGTFYIVMEAGEGMGPIKVRSGL